MHRDGRKKRGYAEDEFGRRTRARVGRSPLSRSLSASRDRDDHRRVSRSRSPKPYQSYPSYPYGDQPIVPRESREGPARTPARRRKKLMTYKEFMMTLRDDVTPEQAQEAYSKYSSDFSKTEERIFWEKHKKEEWFQERYDPVVIEQLRQAKANRVKKVVPKFEKEVLADLVSELKFDCPVLPINKAEKNQTPGFQPPKEVERVEENKSAGIIAPEKAPDSGGDSHISEKTNTPSPSTPQNDEEKETSSSSKGRQEFEGPRSLSKRGRPKISKDDNPLRKEEPLKQSPIDSFYFSSVFFKDVPLEVKRASLLHYFHKREGFRRLVLCDPGKYGQRLRFGWAQFEKKEQCLAALQDTSSNGLNGAKIGPFFLHLYSDAGFRIKCSQCPSYSLTPSRVEQDLLKALELVRKFEGEFNIQENIIFDKLVKDQPTNLLKLNLVLSYLRRVHYTCYYQGVASLTEQKLISHCGPSFDRDRSLKGQEEREAYKPTEYDISWADQVDKRVERLITAEPPESLKTWLEKQKMKIFKENTVKIEEEKFRCKLCGKLFRGPGYVHKHLVNKHSPTVKKYIQAERDRHYFENYSTDPNKLTKKDLTSAPDYGSAAFGDALLAQHPAGEEETAREIPVHYTAPPPRTFASYKDVVLEEEIEDVVAPEASDEEIDYGFGDFIIPPKFNL